MIVKRQIKGCKIELVSKPWDKLEANAYTLRESGGSGGARTRLKSNNDGPANGLPSQIASQKPVVQGRDLAKVVAAWGKLAPALKAAILTIVNSSGASQEDEP